jgi:hypothetical protein
MLLQVVQELTIPHLQLCYIKAQILKLESIEKNNIHRHWGKTTPNILNNPKKKLHLAQISRGPFREVLDQSKGHSIEEQ